MKDLRTYLFALMTLFSAALAAQSRRTDVAMSLDAEWQKKLFHKAELSVGEELRIGASSSLFDRSTSSLSFTYDIIDKRFRVGLHYAYMRLLNDDHYFENRNRYYATAMWRESFGRVTLTWRARIQATMRDERRGEYRFNPKYALRNRVEAKYDIFGSPWKPYLSCEIYNHLFRHDINSFYKIRIEAGAEWRLNRTNYLKFFVRDSEPTNHSDNRKIMAGVGFAIKN